MLDGEAARFEPDQVAWEGAAQDCEKEGVIVLTYEDCIAMCGLTEEEVHAIAEHEHIPELAAAELGNYLITSPDGELCIKSMIRDDIAAAAARANREREMVLKLMLRNFVLNHPACEERHRNMLHATERRAV